MHRRLIKFVVDSHYKCRCILVFSRCGNDYFLRATFDMCHCFLCSTVSTCRIYNIFCSTFPPTNVCSIIFRVYTNLLTIDDDSILILFERSLKTSEYWIVTDHIKNIIQISVSYVDPTKFKLLRLIDGNTECDSANASKSVDANYYCDNKYLLCMTY